MRVGRSGIGLANLLDQDGHHKDPMKLSIIRIRLRLLCMWTQTALSCKAFSLNKRKVSYIFISSDWETCGSKLTGN